MCLTRSEKHSIWRDNGATLEVCEENLHKIGYPDYLLETYLRASYERG